MPIACGQTISQPYVVAYMTEQLAVRAEHRVLEVGTGSGYQAAMLSQLAREVVTVERYRTLADDRAHAAEDARLRQRRGAASATACTGAPSTRPIDRIIVTAAAESMPQALVDQLADGGVMVLPLGPHDGPQQLVQADQDARRASRSEDLICGALRAAAARAGAGTVSGIADAFELSATRFVKV